RRHTRFSRDWSSDVCSSDLARGGPTGGSCDIPRFLQFDHPSALGERLTGRLEYAHHAQPGHSVGTWRVARLDAFNELAQFQAKRSEERRGGKERRSPSLEAR